MQSIVTKFVTPTNTRGSRVRAKVQAGSVTLSWDHGLNADGNHDRAALALIEKMGWVPSQGRAFVGEWIGGDLPDGSRVYVLRSDVEPMNSVLRVAA